ncbi:unnamed protein product [Plasmodium vivax]|uniref:(malaria parasite P. vivax) hypothetical protein n=1 Tax=Plasmodium vivax TaxID=5855 RepID=A0A8S4H769_PLAVI|nr:unnamed protein product [Plasmodium vivax]
MIDSKILYFNKYLRVLLLHLILTSYTYNDLGVTVKFSENKNNVEGLLDFRFHRSLEEQEFQEQYDYQNMNDKLLEDVSKNGEDYGIYYVSPYEQLRQRSSNKVGVLQRNYKNRFGKKSGLAKLDHYIEKKLFYKFDNIYDLEKKMRNDKKLKKKKKYNKYLNRFILHYLLSLPGLIIVIIQLLGKFHINSSICDNIEANTHETCKLFFENIGYVNITILLISYIIIISVFIYGLIKIIKYEKIKAIKGKMCLKEYCNFCKEVIRKT